MMKGMTRVKIAITIPEELLAQVQDAVAQGEARSVSAYISDAVAARGEKRGLAAYVESLQERFGEPPREATEWADRELRRVGVLAPERKGSRSTRAR
jgi:Arc/MetJ-type ribon-helix-helix transcriptional regulator